MSSSFLFCGSSFSKFFSWPLWLLGFTDSLVLQMHYGLLQLDPNKFYGCVCIFHNEYSRVYLDLLHHDHLHLCDCCDYHAASRTSTTTCRTCDIALLLTGAKCKSIWSTFFNDNFSSTFFPLRKGKHFTDYIGRGSWLNTWAQIVSYSRFPIPRSSNICWCYGCFACFST